MGYSIFADTIADLTYPEVEAAAAAGALVLLPVGVIEEHGPHLPLATDVYGAYQLCRLTRRRLLDAGAATVIAPPFYWGVNHVTSAFAGSFLVRPETMRALLDDVLDTLVGTGFERVLLVNHHGDRRHNQVIAEALAARSEPGLRWLDDGVMRRRLEAFADESFWLVDRSADAGAETALGHGGEVETSLVARWFPEVVDWDALERTTPYEMTGEGLTQWRRGGEDARAVTPEGYFGEPRATGFDTWRYYERRAALMAEAVLEAYPA